MPFDRTESSTRRNCDGTTLNKLLDNPILERLRQNLSTVSISMLPT